eukprot:CAMPEP_0168733634 /NCGR_PEP_ID=MMETSP0724-20121128/8394_1 /TAXON_ID=265536 /ORGANISM="Amphiprora sp., Strain CCMP467" /LENGTH=349 /DNA_ID=CAMNT_0008780703 /DNA_START=111 /DNA_END=1160 /DNA_ORIENTATION=+
MMKNRMIRSNSNGSSSRSDKKSNRNGKKLQASSSHNNNNFWSRFLPWLATSSSTNKNNGKNSLKRAHPDRRVKQQQQQQSELEDGAILSSGNNTVVIIDDSDSTTVTDYSSTRSIDTSGGLSMEEVEEEEEVPLPDRTTVVRFRDQVECWELEPTDTDNNNNSNDLEPLFYSTEDYARFKEEYAAQRVRMMMMSSSNNNSNNNNQNEAAAEVVRVLQQTYRACQQVTFETQRCILSRQEEDQLLDCLEPFYQPLANDDTDRTTAALQLVGLEHDLATHASAFSSNATEEQKRRRPLIRIMLKLTTLHNDTNKNRALLEQKTRADRLFARIVGQAQAVLWQDDENDHESE